MLTSTCCSTSRDTSAEGDGVLALDGAELGAAFLGLAAVPALADFAGTGATSSSPPAVTATTCLRESRIAPMANRAASPAKRYHLKSSRRLGAAMTSGP